MCVKEAAECLSNREVAYLITLDVCHSFDLLKGVNDVWSGNLVSQVTF